MAVSFETPACFARSFEFGERLFFRRCQLVRRLLSISRGIGGGLVVGVAAFVFRLSDHCSYFSFHFGAREARVSVSEGWLLANSSGAPVTSTAKEHPEPFSPPGPATGATRSQAGRSHRAGGSPAGHPMIAPQRSSGTASGSPPTNSERAPPNGSNQRCGVLARIPDAGQRTRAQLTTYILRPTICSIARSMRRASRSGKNRERRGATS
jgi:hypothetical protein